MQEENHDSKIDVRIIVSGLDIAQLVSKAVNNIQLENDYNIIVSSIIPTVELSIVKKVASGADILLIGGYGHDETYNIHYNELKTDFNHVGLFDYNNIIVEDESIDFNLAEKEILNSIINSTLSYSLNLINIHTLENKLESFEKLINSTLSGQDSQQLSGQAHDMRSNIDFMKALNESFSYMQLPLKLQNQNTHGDLYVYTQKEKLKQNPEKISILLHLEMDHLGVLDVRLEKDKYNVDARFTLENTDAMQLLQRNTHMLQDSLNEKGYTCNIQVDSGTPKENPVQSFLNTKVTTTATHEMKRFSFDIRA